MTPGLLPRVQEGWASKRPLRPVLPVNCMGERRGRKASKEPGAERSGEGEAPLPGRIKKGEDTLAILPGMVTRLGLAMMTQVSN